MYQEIINSSKDKMEKSVEHFKGEIASLRTGRVSSALVDDIKVNYFGQKMPISQIASVAVQPPSTIVIKPWDKSALEHIGNAISASPLGIAPIAEADFIRINIPALTQERREQLIKLLGQKSEEAKIAIRQEREQTIKNIGALDLSEDDEKKAKDEIQKIVNEYNVKIKEIRDAKEKDILTS